MHRHEDFGKLRLSAMWHRLEGTPDAPVWTDARTNLIGVFKWE
jgi:hypothetical protein